MELYNEEQLILLGKICLFRRIDCLPIRCWGIGCLFLGYNPSDGEIRLLPDEPQTVLVANRINLCYDREVHSNKNVRSSRGRSGAAKWWCSELEPGQGCNYYKKRLGN
jgi:hypothetical protein